MKKLVIMLKDKFAKFAVVRIKEQRIRYVREVKYPGVLVGEQLVES